MKAREKNTGKEITILGISKEWGTATYIEEGILRQKNLSGEWEIIDESEFVDWQAFRREAAKNILCAMIEARRPVTFQPVLIENALMYTNALIEQLKQE